MPAGNSSAARTPFVLLVVLLLAGGLISLLILNSALSEGSFRLTDLKKRTTDLTDEQQALQRDVDDFSAPYALQRRARELGMVPGGSPAFLNADGTVKGEPESAEPQPSGQPSGMEETPPAASSSAPAPAGSPAAEPDPSASGPSPSASAAADPPGTPAPGPPTPTISGR
ncbi:cell division protein FtsL [Streptomyces sp. NBC_01429]|uniref:cell division protein FtsL n=1 Tax=Streptomyces sp. NPDC091212 TaxID=3155191 RepID=UPI002E2C2354|nr:cell division protein FtsL [Streptomyces sp. NBC_01429]